MNNSTFQARRILRYQLVTLALLIALFAIVVLNINIGSVAIPLKEIARILFTRTGDAASVSIIWRIRLPRILMASILGGALSLSGFLLQTFFANPIAGPFVLGISSGAKMTVAVTMILLMSRFGAVSSYALVIAAFVGSLLAVSFILLLSRRLRGMAVLLVAGIMIGYICNAVTDFVVTFADDSDIVNLRSWSLGSFSGMSWESVTFSAVIVGICLIVALAMAKPIDAYRLGESYAQSMGVNIRLFRIALIVLSSVLSATVTAFAGPISFVGIAVPHLTKRLLKTGKPLIVIPVAFLFGAVFCSACDLIARTVFAPTELNISTVTSVFGAPVVIAMMLSRRKEREA